MKHEISLGETLIKMGYIEGWSIEDGKIIWSENLVSKSPKLETIKVKQKELQNEYDKREYQRGRLSAYPPVGEQLDNLYHDIKNGATIDKEGRFFQAIEKVKLDYPKPIEE
jgi:hypothetical protein